MSSKQEKNIEPFTLEQINDRLTGELLDQEISDHKLFQANGQPMRDFPEKGTEREYLVLVHDSQVGELAALYLKRHELELDIPEKRDLKKLIKLGDSATETLVALFKKSVQKQARKKVTESMSEDDLIQEGLIGFLTSIKRFNPLNNKSFAQFASIYILQAIDRAIDKKDKHVRTPTGRREFLDSAIHASSTLQYQLGRLPYVEELADWMKVKPSKITDLIENPPVVVQLETDFEEENFPLKSFISGDSEDEMFDNLLEKRRGEELERVLSTLSEREALIIRVRYGLIDGIPKTLEQIADEIGVTRERIRQIENKAISKLKHPDRVRRLSGY